MTEQGYLRQPAIFGDTLVFVCDDDLWSASTDGGAARRLTAGLADPATPCFSPDGQWLAFVSRHEQHPEVYLMAAEGAIARRMTWHGAEVLVRGFTPDGQILFVTTYGQPFFQNYRPFTLDPVGGLPAQLPLGRANHLSFGPGKAMVIGRNTGDPARWKRYRGGAAGRLWIDADGSGQFRCMSELAPNVTSPMWVGDRIYFLSDSEGVGNLYSVRPDGTDRQRHTGHADYYARHAQSDGKRIVYQCGARIFLFDPSSGVSKQVPLRVPGHRAQAARRFVSAPDYLGGLALHPSGHSLAVDVRGKLFTFGLWEGAVHQHGMVDGARYRQGQWMADGATVVAVSDETGEERVQLWKGKTTRSLSWDIGRAVTMRTQPRGTLIALSNHRNEVIVGDIETGKVDVIDRSQHGRSVELVWSPDGQWLGYTYWTDARHCAIKLYGVASKTATLLTPPAFRDYALSFDPEGKYLYFLSVRTFDPVRDAVQLELSFPRAARPYLIALRAGAGPPFDPPLKALPYERRSSSANDANRQSDFANVRVDLDGIERRVAAFPVPENKFGQIAGVIGNKVIWTVLPLVGSHGRGGHRDPMGRLELFNFETLRTEVLSEKVDSFTVAEDRSMVVIRNGKRLRAIPSTRRVDTSDPESRSEIPSRRSGWIDLTRIRAAVDPRSEWRQMLREVWRLQRDQFWLPNMSGIDWNAVHDKYAPLVDRVSSRGELSDLIWEMHGELGTSHAYERGGDHRKSPPCPLGSLGAEYKLAADGESYEIARTIAGDPWDPGADSPLNAIGVEAKVGERIIAINGQRVSREQPPQSLLVNQANAKVELILASKDGERSVVATTLADEGPSRYREWVETNRNWVHEQSKGRVGYFHLPDTYSGGFAEFHRYFAAECDRHALIVDVRFNCGGAASQLLLEKLARKRIGYTVSRWTKPSPYPNDAVLGPVIALANEYTSSDGEIFSHNFKLMKLGPLIGVRTWGGVVGARPRHRLVDGCETTQPEFSFWFADAAFDVENRGTNPDIEVDIPPEDARQGRDRQLETAVATALDLIEKTKPGVPSFDVGPRRSLRDQIE